MQARVDAILYVTGNYQNGKLYKLNFIPITLSTVRLSNSHENEK